MTAIEDEKMQKKKLIKATKKTFFEYLKLDFAREFHFSINNEKTTFTNYVQELIDSKTLTAENNKHQCTIAGVNCFIELNDNKIILISETDVTGKIPFKEINEYDDNDALLLLSNTLFSIGRHKKNNKLCFGLTIDIDEQSFNLGGPEKYELYRSHLVSLHKIINHLEEHDDIKPMLAALATGSGKTFLQGLFYLSLRIARLNGVFAQPENLLDQFRSDLKNLLPDELVEEMGSAENFDAHPFILDSYENLLDHYFETLYEDEDAIDTVLIFDEQHQAMENESRRVKLKELARKKLCLFLTATPNKETFEMCGKKPVAISSALEKQLEGQGSFPKIVILKTQNLREKMKAISSMPLKERFRVGILIPVFDALMGEYNPPTAWTAFKDLALRVKLKNPENNDGSREFLRNHLEMPSTHKILFLTNSTDELINIREFVDSQNFPTLYENGGESLQNNGFFFDVAGAHDLEREEAFTHYLNNIDPNNIISHKPKKLSDQLQKTIYHNMVDLFLREVTGLTTIELNQLRNNDLQKLVKIVNEKFNPKLHCQKKYLSFKFNIKFNPKGIDADGAEKVGQILAGFGSAFEKMSQQSQKNFIDNWVFDEETYAEMKNSVDELNNFTKKHCTMFIMKGKETAETPIPDDSVFFEFDSEKVPVYDENMLPTKEAKRRKKSFFEQLDKDTFETHYSPKVELNISETIANNYFENGLVGIYVSNKKGEGFNDLGIHTVVCTLPNSADTFNEPAKMIQAIGRNRGLDPTITPYFIQCFGKNSESIFDLSLLERTSEYYPEYFKADLRYRKILLRHLAKIITADIQRSLHKNLTDTNTVDHISLKWVSLRSIVKALRVINNKNSHEIKLTRSQLSTLLYYVRKEINAEINSLKKPYIISPNILFLFALIHSVFSIIYFFKTYKLKISLIKKTQEIKKALKNAENESNSVDTAKNHAQLLYIKILKQRYATLGTQTLIFEELFSALSQIATEQSLEDTDISDYILHPQFFSACKQTYGVFSFSELSLLINIIQSKDLNEENEEAAELLEFLDQLKHKNYDAIDINHFMNTLFPLIKSVHAELKNCHMHFLQLDGRTPSALCEQLEKTGIPDIHIKNDNSTLLEVMGKISTLYPLIAGMSKAGEIKAVQHKPEIKALERVNAHIIKPLKRSSSLSSLGLWLVQLGKTLKTKLSPPDDSSLLEEIEEASTSYSYVAEALEKESKPTLSEAQLNTNYEQDADEIGLQIRHTKPYSLEEVRKNGCKVDSIQGIIDFIDDKESFSLRAG